MPFLDTVLYGIKLATTYEPVRRQRANDRQAKKSLGKSANKNERRRADDDDHARYAPFFRFSEFDSYDSDSTRLTKIAVG